MLEFCRWLADTPGSVALHESLWGYPVVESIHVLTLCLFLGLTIVMDLRLTGIAFTTIPVSRISQRLLPLIFCGFAIMVVTGLLLFYAIPVKTYLNVFFRIKLIALVLAGINAGLFHFTIERNIGAWENDATPPPRARLAGGVSLFLWAVIVISGRLIAYNWFEDPSIH